MDDIKSLKELTKQLTSIYMSETTNRRKYSIEVYTKEYLETYKKIYISLTSYNEFDKKINNLAKEISLTYIKEYISSCYVHLEIYINTFITAYKYALSELTEEEKENPKNQILPEYIPGKFNYVFKHNEDEERLPQTTILPKYTRCENPSDKINAQIISKYLNDGKLPPISPSYGLEKNSKEQKNKKSPLWIRDKEVEESLKRRVKIRGGHPYGK